MSKEAEKFATWFEKEKLNGLVDIKFFTGDVSASSTEHFFREANAMNVADAVDVTDHSESFERYEVPVS